MSYVSTNDLIRRALNAGTVLPAFNIPYLPMVEPVVRALRDCNSVGLVMAARLEWIKFETESPEALKAEYDKYKLPGHTRLHLDHVPVIDEDNLRVDYLDDIRRALDAGYESVMVDGSRLPLDENIACTKSVVELAHAAGVPGEARNTMARLSVVIDELIEEYALDAIAFRCWLELEKQRKLQAIGQAGYRHHVSLAFGHHADAVREAFTRYLNYEMEDL
jgi:hypothetical protein